MKYTNINRDKQITIRVSQHEKDLIAKNAKAHGVDTSEFARDQLLNPGRNSSNDALRQTMVRNHCRLCELIKKIDDSGLRHRFEALEEDIWQSLK